MKKTTLSQAKNMMRRALRTLLDRPPGPAAQRRLRDHFKNRCAYCDAPAEPRDGHIDHAVPDGGNGLGNLLLACKRCNGDEKREMPWEAFLHKKCGADGPVFAQRRQHILAWIHAHPRPPQVRPPEVEEALRAAEAAIAGFERAYNEVRRAALAASPVRDPLAPEQG